MFQFRDAGLGATSESSRVSLGGRGEHDMLNLTQIDCATPITGKDAEAACDLGLDHPHVWAHDGRPRAQGPCPAQLHAVRVPSTVLHDDIHYAAD
jgi:hypothetical protein